MDGDLFARLAGTQLTPEGVREPPGVAEFQTNPIVAAAAATYAGTVARKAAQHAFLAEAGA